MVGKKPNHVIGNTFFHLFYNPMKKSKASRLTNKRKKVYKKRIPFSTCLHINATKEVSNAHIDFNGSADNDTCVYEKTIAKDTNNDGTETESDLHEIPVLPTDSPTGKETKDLVVTEAFLNYDQTSILNSPVPQQGESVINKEMKDKFMPTRLAPLVSTQEQQWKEDNAVLEESKLRRCREEYTEIKSSPCRSNPEDALELSVKTFPSSKEAANSSTPNVSVDISTKENDEQRVTTFTRYSTIYRPTRRRCKCQRFRFRYA